MLMFPHFELFVNFFGICTIRYNHLRVCMYVNVIITAIVSNGVLV